MKKSWKTTLFGYMAAAGTGLIGAERTGIIDGSTIPMWVNQIATICSVVGLALLGQAARDNGVSSEQAGAGNVPPKDPQTTDKHG